VPQRLARACHPHRERQERKQRAALIVIQLAQLPVRAHARVMIYVARLCHADDRMQQERPRDSLRSPLGQFFVCALERIARLKSHHISVADARQPTTHFGGRQA
jgi:hypothetical protein